MRVWRDGRVVTGDEAALASDRGLLLGDGLFETIHVLGGRAEHLGRHLARMTASAAALGVALVPDLAGAIAAALPSLVRAEGSPPRGALRVTLTRGAARAPGLAPPEGPPALVLAFAALPPREAGEPAPAATAVVVDAPRIDPLDPLVPHKTLSRMPRVEARRRAVARGADFALMTTVDGDVAEADSANLFVVLGGVLVTPGLDRGVLPGITRGRCLEALAAAGTPCTERRISREELARCDEAFLTSSLDGVRPLGAIDGRAFAAPGPAARRLARCIAPDGRA